MTLDKHSAPTLIALLLVFASYALPAPYAGVVLSVGLFAFSGALTNRLAVHMLFHRVPGLYGSGVVPANFAAFKDAIHALAMRQLFTDDGLQRAFDSLMRDDGGRSDASGAAAGIDLNEAFDQLAELIAGSSFGNMLNMLGGKQALEPLRKPFIERMGRYIDGLLKSPALQLLLRQRLEGGGGRLREALGRVVRERLDALSPDDVNRIVQDMIRAHLGWLVVWGGVFGGLIGLLGALLLG